MKLILHVIILSALASYYSISALRCYKCAVDINSEKE